MRKEYTYNPSEMECKAIFVASCIECAADAFGISADAMYRRMARINIIHDYIIPCYGVLHAESRQSVTEDIVRTIRLWEERKGVQA